MDMTRLRLLISAGAVLSLVVGLVVVANDGADKTSVTVLAAALALAVPNLMTQLSSDASRAEVKKELQVTNQEIHANTHMTAQTTATVQQMAKAQGVETPSPTVVEDVLARSQSLDYGKKEGGQP
jgi:hypothetical protein